MANAVNAKSSQKNVFHVLFALAIWLIFKFLVPAPAPITADGIEIIGIFIMALYLWIFVGTGWTSILTVCLLGMTKYMTPAQAIKGSFGDWMFSFLMGCMMVNAVLSETGLSRRIAVWFITRKFTKGRPYLIISMFFTAMFALGLFMTSSATCVMFLALAKEILDTCGYDRKERFSQFLFCCIAWITIAGNGMTAIGHGNFITGMGWVSEAFGIKISIAQSAIIGCSIGIVWIVLLILIMKMIYKMDASRLVNLDMDELKSSMTKMSKAEKFAGGCFAAVVLCWVAGDITQPIPLLYNTIGAFCSGLGSAIPILLCVCVLCVVPVDGKPLMNFNTMTKKIAWQSCMMIGTVRLLGTVFADEKLGITAWMQSVFGPVVQGMPAALFVVVCIGIALLATNFVSNSIAMVLFKVAAPLTLLIPGVNGPALGVVMICAIHYAMWTPGCTTTTSFVCGSGDVEGSFMVRYGWVPMIAAFIALVTVGYGVGCLVF
ncbi:SLC13 family permease [Caproiciproducens sp. R1]|uniref:SLC13 family permease n=1 Tax=Caproiciproducens sp. R1 TaxID=3435000 RepID=UPI00403351C3